MTQSTTDSLNGTPIVAFSSQQEWQDWLAANHAAAPALWLKLAKKGSGQETVTYDEAVETALCYGWIDSQKRAFDEAFWLQRFTPRKPRSIWSKVNCAKAEELIADGQMQPAGLAAVEQAKANGQWEAAYDSQSTAAVPDDLQTALEQNPDALAFFATLNSSNRYAILHRVMTARKPETRARRIGQLVEMLEHREKLYP